MKAIFFLGSSGSGKSYIQSNIFGFNSSLKTTSYSGLKLISSDVAFEYFIKKNGYTGKDLSNSKEIFIKLTHGPDSLRERAKSLTTKIEQLYLNNRLGLVLEGTGLDYSIVYREKLILEKLGYDTYLAYVDVPMEVALYRNRNRDRTLPDHIVIDAWKKSHANLEKFKTLFGKNLIILDNSNSGKFEESNREKIKQIISFLNSPIENTLGMTLVSAKAALT